MANDDRLLIRKQKMADLSKIRLEMVHGWVSLDDVVLMRGSKSKDIQVR